MSTHLHGKQPSKWWRGYVRPRTHPKLLCADGHTVQAKPPNVVRNALTSSHAGTGAHVQHDALMLADLSTQYAYACASCSNCTCIMMRITIANSGCCATAEKNSIFNLKPHTFLRPWIAYNELQSRLLPQSLCNVA